MDTDAHPIYNNEMTIINEDKTIRIGHHVWIGCKSMILKGAEIADGCIIGANTFINNKFLNVNSIIAGNPAKIVKSEIKW